jgi:glucose/arabinose dehydrogenase
MRFFVLLAALAFTATHAFAEPRISRGRVAEEGGVRLAPLVDGLAYPWSMTWLPDGALVVTEREGRLRLIRDGVLSSEPIAFPAPVTSGGDGGITRGQGGLMDVAASPNFARDRTLYFTYAEGDPKANRTVVARARLEGARLTGLTPIYRNPDMKERGQHFGSRMLFMPDGSLLVSIGDGGNPPVQFRDGNIRLQAQSLSTVFGKVLRLTPDGRAQAGNPFLGASNARGEIWTLGHRNVQGLAHDSVTGKIWASEHGAAGGDELNRLDAGVNYGWPAVTYAREYADGALISDKTRAADMRDPVLVWLDTHAPSGLAVYQGDRLPGLKGAILSGGLVTQDIRVVRPQEGQRARETRIPVGERVRDVRVGPDGFVYVLTDGERGRVLRLEPAA